MLPLEKTFYFKNDVRGLCEKKLHETQNSYLTNIFNKPNRISC